MIPQYDTHREFERQYKRAPSAIRNRLWERLEMLADNPDNPLLRNHKLNPPWEGYHSINVTGDWRLVYKQLSGNLFYLRAVGTHHQLFGS